MLRHVSNVLMHGNNVIFFFFWGGGGGGGIEINTFI